MELKSGYKETDIGVLPEQWEAEKLGKHAKFRTGPFGSALHQSDYVDDGVPVINPMQIVDGKIVPTPSMAISPQAARKLADFRLEVGNVVIGRRGQMGRCAYVRAEEDGWLCGTGSMIIRTGPSLDARFIQRVLSSSPIIAAIENASVGSTMINLNQGTLGNLTVPVPPTKAEQESIAEALSDADVLIESLEKLIGKKHQIKQGAMQELLTGKKRLPGFACSDAYKHTELGVIPNDWDVNNLTKICSMKSGESITGARIDSYSEYPCYGSNGLRGFTARYTHNGRYSLVGRQGALCGNVFGVEGQFFASEHAIVVTASTQTDIGWLTFVLQEMRLNQYSESSAQPGLSVSKLLQLHIVCPSTKDEQEAIADVLTNMDAELAVLESKLIKSRQLKQGMMQVLLTGRIRLV